MLVRFLLVLFFAVSGFAETSFHDLDAEPHRYSQRTPRDRFTALKSDLETGRVVLNASSEKAALLTLLKALDVPASSQALVFSTTSLQLRLISRSNPRAIYFSEEVYVGFIPGGRIEIVALDPELGAIFYICDLPRQGRELRAERSERCMNCHAASETGNVPGLVLKSVVPGPQGGSLVAFRQEQTGHAIPFAERFGGWFVTGRHGIMDHLGNTVGRLFAGTLTKSPVDPAQSFDASRYPLATSDVLPQLLLEHQAGFVNRVVEAGYRARTALHADGATLTAAHAAELDEQARLVTRYLLFADEVPLPAGGVDGEASFKADFLRNRRANPSGAALKDFDLQTRLFRARCSYMIYSNVFTGLPPAMKERIYRRLGEAVNIAKPDAEYAYLPTSEKLAIREILAATLPDLPPGW